MPYCQLFYNKEEVLFNYETGILQSLIYLRQMRKTIMKMFMPRFCNKKQKIIEEYNNKIDQIKKIENIEQRTVKLSNTMNEMGVKLNQFQKQSQLQKIKQYLIGGLKNAQSKPDEKNTQKGYIPNNLIVKKLKFLDKKILMLGLQQENEEHCIYLKKMAQKFNSKIILTSLPPDMPYFIKTELSFAQQWQKFIKNPRHAKQAKFYLNPSPNAIADSFLGKIQIQLVRNNLNKSKQFNQIFYTILKYSKRHRRYLPNGLLTPLLVNSVQKVYFCDYPILKQRQLWAMTIPINQMRDLFKIFHQEYHKDKEMLFDARILFPKTVIQKKFAYMANAVKYASHQSKQPCIFVCPAQYAEMFSMQFKKDKTVTPYSDFSSPLNYNKNVTFIQFVQKLVIMDIILQPVIDKYFIKYVSFPYTTLQTVGGKENIGKIFIVWNHFHNLYKDALQKAPV